MADRWMNEALAEGFERSKNAIRLHSMDYYGKKMRPSMKLELKHSPAEPCLWFSDWISWESGRWLRMKDTSEEFNSCSDLMVFLSFDENGTKLVGKKLGGVAIDKFPDYPRSIQSVLRRGN